MQIINYKHMRKHMFPAAKRRAKLIFAIIKPAFTALAFLLASGLIPLNTQNLANLKPVNPVPCVGTAAAGSLAISGGIQNQTIQIGTKAVTITKHAAQRMLERGVKLQDLAKTIEYGEKFYYFHSGIGKIGYFDSVSEIFVAADRKNGRVITVIKGISKIYINKLKQNFR